VRDFETDEAEYEIYTYGEETVVVPAQSGSSQSKTQELAREQLKYRLQEWVKNPEIEFESDDRVTIYVDEDDIPRLIGHQGETIEKIEDEVGMHITVEPRNQTLKDPVDFEVEEVGNSVAIRVGEEHAGAEANIFDGDEHLFTATVGKNGQIRLTKSSGVASRLLGAYTADRLEVFV
ncbi:MAG: KH domain-containing protein, partial [Candidatus Nanohaloarchaea archaeon]|nr:KH domain-containing protein [Candidatus Nanohaloarchaea archaeon]